MEFARNRGVDCQIVARSAARDKYSSKIFTIFQLRVTARTNLDALDRDVPHGSKRKAANSLPDEMDLSAHSTDSNSTNCMQMEAKEDHRDQKNVASRENQIEQWNIWRRYSEFRDLFSALVKRNASSLVPVPPPKKLLNTMDPVFLDDRQEKLEKWIRLVLAMHESLSGWAYVVDFLSPSSTLPKHRPITVMPQDNALSGYYQPADLEDVRRKIGTIPPLEETLSTDSMSCHSECSGDMSPDFVMNSRRVSLRDFVPLKVVGKGSFGKVVVVKRRQTNKLYAMKILEKCNIKKRKQVEHTKTERRVLESVNHPFIVDMFFAFQTKTRLFMVLEYVPGGELFFHLGKSKFFPEEWVRLWIAEVVLALEHLHERDVVFRDLKPENILLDQEGHVKLIDFGLCKDGISELASGTNSFCGTPEYLAPELLERKGHGKAVDFWNLGMVTYEMLTGLPPWYTENKRRLFYRLRTAPLRFPEGMSEPAKDLIGKLLIRDPLARLGSGKEGYGEIKDHIFFQGIDWDKLLRKEITPGFKPPLTSTPIEFRDRCLSSESLSQALDTSNFDSIFTDLPLNDVDLGYDEPTLFDASRRANHSPSSSSTGGGKPVKSNASVCSEDSTASSQLGTKLYDDFSFQQQPY